MSAMLLLLHHLQDGAVATSRVLFTKTAIPKLASFMVVSGIVFNTVRNVYTLLKLRVATGFPVNWTCLLTPWVHDIVVVTNPTKLKEIHEKMGPVFCTLVAGNATVVLGTAELAQRIQNPSNSYKVFRASPRTPCVQQLLTKEAIVLKDGEGHKRDRRVLVNAVGPSSLSRWYTIIVKRFHKAMGELESANSNGEFNDLVPVVESAIFDVMFEVIVGSTSSSDVKPHVKSLLAPFARGLFSVSSMSHNFREALRARQELVNCVRTEIVWRKNTLPDGGMDRDDFIQNHLRETPDVFLQSDESISGRLVNPLFASLDTTKGTTCHLWDCIIDNPAEMEKLYHEIVTAFGDLGALSEKCTFQTLAELPRLDAFVREVLRTSKQVSSVTRKTCIDVEFEGNDGSKRYVPAGSAIVGSVFWIKDNNPYTKDPHKFDPDRFLPPRNEHELDPFFRTSFNTFGYGFRQCPGQHLATAEIRLFACLAAFYVWERKERPQKYQYLPFRMPLSHMVRGIRRS